MRLIQIQTHNLYLAWKDAEPYLIEALALNQDYKLDDMYKLCKEEKATLWMLYDNSLKKTRGAMVTEIFEHPQGRVLNIFLLGADSLDDVVHPLFPEFLEWLKLNHIVAIECMGRFGLERLLKDLGFHKSYIVMRYNVN